MGANHEPYSYIKNNDSELYNVLVREVSREEETSWTRTLYNSESLFFINE